MFPLSLVRPAACVAGVACTLLILAGAKPDAQNGRTWVTAWGTSQQTLGETRVSNATVRMVARVTIPGDAIRIRLDNTFGTMPLTIGRAAVAVRIQGAAVAAGSNRPVTFAGAARVTIPAGGTIWSDPV